MVATFARTGGCGVQLDARWSLFRRNHRHEPRQQPRNHLHAVIAAASRIAPWPDACVDPVRTRGEISRPPRPAPRRPLAWSRCATNCSATPALPAVLVAGGISAHRHVGEQRSVPRGGLVGSAGRRRPRAGSDPAPAASRSTGWAATAALDAVIDPADQADAIAAVLDALRHRTPRTHSSAVPTARWSACSSPRGTPTRLGQLVAISGAHRAHPFSSAWRALQRRAVALGALQCDESHGLALARQLAILSYRTPEEFAERFDARAGRRRPRARGRRGLPRPLRRAVRRAHLAGRLPAPVRIDRPAGRRTRAHRRAGDGGGGRAGPAGAASRTASRWPSACAARRALRVLRSRLRPRRLPQGRGRDRRRPRPGAAGSCDVPLHPSPIEAAA